MRRIAAKLLRQSMLVSAEDDLGEHVLPNYIANYIGAYTVWIMWKNASHKRIWCQRKSWEEQERGQGGGGKEANSGQETGDDKRWRRWCNNQLANEG